MPRFICDHNLRDAIRYALIARNPDWDVATARAFGLTQTPDPDLMAWAVGEGRIVLTHDANTMPGFANARLLGGEPMTGVIVVDGTAPSGQLLSDIELLAACDPADWDYWVMFVPIR